MGSALFDVSFVRKDGSSAASVANRTDHPVKAVIELISDNEAAKDKNGRLVPYTEGQFLGMRTMKVMVEIMPDELAVIQA